MQAIWKMNSNEALRLLGPNNLYIWFWFIIIALVQAMPSAFSTFSFMFVSREPEQFHCNHPDHPGPNMTNWLPREIGPNDTLIVSKCKQYADKDLGNETQQQLVPCQNGYVYAETDHYKTSIVQDWDLVCDRKYIKQIANSCFFIFSILGGLLVGGFADRIGRRPVFLFLLTTFGLLLFCTAFSPNVYVYIAMRSVSGVVQDGVMVVGYCLLVELFPIQLRTSRGIVVQLAWSFSCFLLTGIVYCVRSWRLYYLVISGPFLLFFTIYPFLPESVVWLVSKDRLMEARKILKRAIRWSNSNKLTRNAFIKLSNKKQVDDELDIGVSSPVEYRFSKMFTHPILLKFIITNMILWFTVALCFYGVQLQAMKIGDYYLNFFLGNLFELPSYPLVIYTLARYGRRRTLTVFFFMVFLTSLMGYIMRTRGSQTEWPTIACLMIAKFFISAIFATLFLYTTEMFPTTLRNAALALSSGSGRLGVALTPYLIERDKRVIWIAIFCTTLLSGALCQLFFVETRHRALPNRIEEIEDWVDERNERRAKV